MQLDQYQRLVLINQYEILKQIDQENADAYDKNLEILREGYEIFYDGLDAAILNDPLPVSTAEQVEDILDMYRAIRNSLNWLETTHDHHWAKFRGFDGNQEWQQFNFLCFLVDRRKKWQVAADQPRNSHMATLWKYTQMLAVWKSIPNRQKLTFDQVDQIVRAGDRDA